VGSRYMNKITEGAKPFLKEGEEVLAAVVARPRGWSQAMAGGSAEGAVAGALGRRKQQQAQAAGQEAGFPLASPMALALTQKRLLTLEIGSPIGLGVGGDVKTLVGAVPIDDVESIEVKRLLLGKVVTITVRGTPVALDVNAAADARGLAEQFDRAKAGASP
jgi:hypothetical protein